MALTKHHDLINTDYFSNTFYVRELERNIERKLTALEKDIIENTLRTFLKINNEWSNYAHKTNESFKKNKEELENYLKKYERKISDKFVDLFCIELYKTFEIWLDEMNDIETRDLDKKCNSIKSQVSKILEQLEEINFDYDFNGYFYYKRNPSNKTKRHYSSLLEYKEELENYIKEYNKRNEYYSIIDDMASDEVLYIRALFRTFADLSRFLKNDEVEFSLKSIIRFLVIEKPRYLNDDFKNEINRIESISYMIIEKDFESAYQETLKFIKLNEKWYVRAS